MKLYKRYYVIATILLLLAGFAEFARAPKVHAQVQNGGCILIAIDTPLFFAIEEALLGTPQSQGYTVVEDYDVADGGVVAYEIYEGNCE